MANLPIASSAAAPGAWRSNSDEVALTPILRHALEAFHEFGYHGTSVRDIARRTGLTVPALYYHHANKEAILFTLLDDSITAVIRRCGQALAEAGGDPQQRFMNLIECLALYMTQQSERAAMDAEIRALGPDSRKRYIAKREQVEQLLQDAIVDGQRAGAFSVTSARETTRALLGMIWAITVWFRPDGDKTPAEVARSYVDIALHTVSATVQSDSHPHAERRSRRASHP